MDYFVWINWGHVQADGSEISCGILTVYIPSTVLLPSSSITALVVIYNSYASKLSRLPALYIYIFFSSARPSSLYANQCSQAQFTA
jgi:hypothetical protein